MRFAAMALRRRAACPPDAHPRLDGAQHEVRRSALRPLPVRADARLPRRPGVHLGRSSAAAGGAGAVMADAPRPTLAVWKFASCDGCQLTPARLRGRAAGRRRARRDRLLPRGDARRRSRGRTTCRSSRARSPRRTTSSASRRSARSRSTLITIGACATAGGIQALRNFADVDGLHRRSSTPRPSTSRRWRPRRRSATHVHGRLRAARLPDRQAPAARGAQRASSTAAARTSPAHSVCVECKLRGNVCVMVAHGTPCLGPGHARRLRRALPGLRPRLLRLLRADGDAEHRRRSARSWRELGMRRRATSCGSTAPSTPHAEPFRESERTHMAGEPRHADDHRSTYLARVEGEGGDARRRSATARVDDVRAAASTSRRASSRRSCAAARSPRRPTSPRASAASARSPTR